MTIDTLEIIKLINKLSEYSDVALFGSTKEGFRNALSLVGNFISAYEEHEGKVIAQNHKEG